MTETLTHCLERKTMEVSDICKRLNEQNVKSVVIKDCKDGFKYKQRSDKLTWSEWEVSIYLGNIML